MPGQSPSQTVGPFFHDALFTGGDHVLLGPDFEGSQIVLRGTVYDGDGEPVPDALVEIWQADGQGVFSHPRDPNRAEADPNFRGFGRSATVDRGRFQFLTVKPGVSPNQAAPFITFRIFARGLLVHAVGRIYFADEADKNAEDEVFRAVPVARRHTLMATRDESAPMATYRFDIHLQGDAETVFFNP